MLLYDASSLIPKTPNLRISRQPIELQPEAKLLSLAIELHGCPDPLTLLEHFGTNVFIADHNQQFIVLELRNRGEDLDTALSRLCVLVESLPAWPQQCWRDCERKVLDVSYQTGLGPHAFRSVVTATTLARLAGLGLELELTLFGAQVGG